jgi:hypothetical protein
MTDPNGTHDARTASTAHDGHAAGLEVPHVVDGPRVSDVHGASHAVEGAHGSTSDHGGDGHGHDDHAHGDDALGPTDWTMWGAGVLGVVLALLVAACFVLGTGFVFGG